MREIQREVQDIAAQDEQGEAGLLKFVLDKFPHPALIVDSSFRTISWANSACEKVLGFKPEDLVGKSTRVLHVDDRQYDAFGQKSASVVLDGETFRGRHWMKHADGSNVPTEHIVTAVRLIEGRMAVVSFIKNLTENEESDFAARLTRLTPRETEVFNLTAKGYSAKHLADELKITLRTAEAHRAAVLEKLGYSSTNELLGDLISSKSKHGL